MDQAEQLRKIMGAKLQKSKDKKSTNKEARVISISSGKGGVGKTNFAINFAIYLKKLGNKVVIIDADIGLGNVEILSGISMKYTISDIIFSNQNIVNIMGEGPEGIKIISGGSGLKELALLNDENFPRLLEEIEKLQSLVDYIIIDTGAGISSLVMDFIMASDEVIVVSTGDPTSIMDSYVLIKSLTSTGFKGKINIVANLVKNKREGIEVYSKLNNASINFLQIKTNYLGYIERSDIVSLAVRNQIPFVVSHPNNTISKMIESITMNFLNNKNDLDNKENISFARRILKIFKMR